jgi:hypothetical protein
MFSSLHAYKTVVIIAHNKLWNARHFEVFEENFWIQDAFRQVR